MAYHLKHIPQWNAIEITNNGRNPAGVSSNFYQFLDTIPEHLIIRPGQYTVMIPDIYLPAYLEKFEWITTTNQTIKSMLGTEEAILPEINYELQHLDTMKLEPYPFQKIASEFLLTIKKGIVGDEVGLGFGRN